MKQLRIVVAGAFDRYPEGDREGTVGAWRAWRNLYTGGLWYGTDSEDYSICEKVKCPQCFGSGRSCECAERWASTMRGALAPELCLSCGESVKCVICDGTGFYYIPSPVNVG